MPREHPVVEFSESLVADFYDVAGFIPEPELAVAISLEEAKELNETTFNTMAELEHRLKELGDFIFTIAGCQITADKYGVNSISDVYMSLDDEDTFELDLATNTVMSAMFTNAVPADILITVVATIYASNMSKFAADEEGKLYNPNKEQTKVVKGPDYEAPDLKPLAQALAQYWYEEGFDPLPEDFEPVSKEQQAA